MKLDRDDLSRALHCGATEWLRLQDTGSIMAFRPYAFHGWLCEGTDALTYEIWAYRRNNGD